MVDRVAVRLPAIQRGTRGTRQESRAVVVVRAGRQLQGRVNRGKSVRAVRWLSTLIQAFVIAPAPLRLMAHLAPKTDAGVAQRCCSSSWGMITSAANAQADTWCDQPKRLMYPVKLSHQMLPIS